MFQRITFFFLLLSGIYVIYKNRYRIINIIFGNRIIRRMFVSVMMSFPFVRKRMVDAVFSGVDS